MFFSIELCKCCIFWLANGCSACCLLVEIIFFLCSSQSEWLFRSENCDAVAVFWPKSCRMAARTKNCDWLCSGRMMPKALKCVEILLSNYFHWEWHIFLWFLLFWHPFGLSVTFGQSLVWRSFLGGLSALSFGSGLEPSFYYEIDTPLLNWTLQGKLNK